MSHLLARRYSRAPNVVEISYSIDIVPRGDSTSHGEEKKKKQKQALKSGQMTAAITKMVEEHILHSKIYEREQETDSIYCLLPYTINLSSRR